MVIDDDEDDSDDDYGPLAEYGHMVRTNNALLDGSERRNGRGTLKRKDFSVLNDVISLFFLPLCVVCHPARLFCTM